MTAPEISVIIPVLNEAAAITAVVRDVMAQRGAVRCEIIVVDGSPAGETIRALSGSGVVTMIAGPGRGRQMNAGAAAARGDILLFLHADTQLPAGALEKISTAVTADGCAAGAFSLRIGSPRPIFRLIEKTATLRSRITGVPYGDQAIFVRRDVFDDIGRYGLLPVMEDIDLMERLRRRGVKVRILPDAVITSARRWEREGVLRCTIRNRLLVALRAAGVPVHRLASWYRAF